MNLKWKYYTLLNSWIIIIKYDILFNMNKKKIKKERKTRKMKCSFQQKQKIIILDSIVPNYIISNCEIIQNNNIAALLW
jgi:hypothetical protein